MEITVESRSQQIPKDNRLAKFYSWWSRSLRKLLRLKNEYVKWFLSEMFGTFLIVLFSCASIAQYKLALYDQAFNQNILSVNLCVGLSLSFAIIATAKTSGGHVNPAISFATVLIGKMSAKKFLTYVCAQFLGAFIGACVVFVTYFDSLKNYPKDFYSDETASIFTTFPSPELSIFGNIFGETLGTFLFVLSYLIINDAVNTELNNTYGALFMGMTLTIIGTSLGYKAAHSINPARDFSPRLFTLIAGWGTRTFTNGRYFFLIPLLAPFLGASIAVIVYTIFIRNL